MVKHRHDGIESQFGISGSRQASHELRLLVGFRKRSVDQIHQLYRCHRGRVADRRAIDRLAAQRGHNSLAAVHGLNGSRPGYP